MNQFPEPADQGSNEGAIQETQGVDPAVPQGIAESTAQESPQTNSLDAGATLPAPPMTGSADPFELLSESDRFHVHRLHAQGGLGAVHAAVDRQFKREVAVKSILPKIVDVADARHRFVQEAKITGVLEHPGVVPVYALGLDCDSRPYYAMRFIHGMSMEEAIKKRRNSLAASRDGGRSSLRKLLRQFVDVCSAIAYAHSKSVIHRDLKPDNIMLGDFGETLVVDWGLAAYVVETTDTELPNGEIVGTPAFMPPEQAAGDPVSTASDVYSLGATLYAILTSRRPVDGKSLVEVLAKVRKGKIIPPQARVENGLHAPPALSAIAMKAMSLQPENRYASAEALAEDIEAYLADDEVSAYQEPIFARTSRWLRRHRTFATGVGVAGVALMALSFMASIGLTVANQREHKLRVAAQQQRQKAEKHLVIAQSAVGDFLYAIAREERLQNQGLETLQKELLAEGAGRLRELLALESDNQELQSSQQRQRYMLAVALLRLGDYQQAKNQNQGVIDSLTGSDGALTSEKRELAIQAYTMGGIVKNVLGDNKAAESDFAQAIQLSAEALKVDPIAPRVLRLATELEYHRCVYFKRIQKHAQFANSLNRALSLSSQSMRISPNHRETQALHQRLLAMQARAGFSDGSAKGINQLSAIVEVLKTNVANAPDDSVLNREYVEALEDLGAEQTEQGQFSEALKTLNNAASLTAAQQLQHPDWTYPKTQLPATRVRIGRVHALTGELTRAVEAFEAGVFQYKELLRADPENTYLRKSFASSATGLATVYRKTGEIQKSRNMADELRTLCESWMRGSPEDASANFYMASALMQLALIDELERDQNAAREKYQLALTYVEQFAAENSGSSMQLAQYARLELSIANLQLMNREFAESEASVKRAIPVLDRLANDSRLPVGDRLLWPVGYARLAESLRQQEKWVESVVSCDKGLQTIAKLEQRWPKLRESFSDVTGLLAACKFLSLEALNDTSGRLEVYPLVIKHADPKLRSTIRGKVPGLLLEVGRHREAVQSAVDLAEEAGDQRERFVRSYKASWVISQAIAAVDADIEMSPEQRESVKSAYAKSAIGLLQWMRNAGGLTSIQQLDDLKTRKILAPLRERLEFQQWIKTVSQK